MFLTRWQAPETPAWAGFDRLSNLREEIDRLFESPLAELARSSHALGSWAPALDLYEDKDHFLVRAELPGMKKEEIEISLHEGALLLTGERKREEKTKHGETYREERFYGRFHRSIALPKPVAADRVTASYKYGVLTVTLPKTEEVKPKQIEVTVK
jgi:HSP20 family protein